MSISSTASWSFVDSIFDSHSVNCTLYISAVRQLSIAVNLALNSQSDRVSSPASKLKSYSIGLKNGLVISPPREDLI